MHGSCIKCVAELNSNSKSCAQAHPRHYHGRFRRRHLCDFDALEIKSAADGFGMASAVGAMRQQAAGSWPLPRCSSASRQQHQPEHYTMTSEPPRLGGHGSAAAAGRRKCRISAPASEGCRRCTVRASGASSKNSAPASMSSCHALAPSCSSRGMPNEHTDAPATLAAADVQTDASTASAAADATSRPSDATDAAQASNRRWRAAQCAGSVASIRVRRCSHSPSEHREAPAMSEARPLQRAITHARYCGDTEYRRAAPLPRPPSF